MTAPKAFVDSNIFIYLLSDDLVKRQAAQKLLLSPHFISTQIVAESVNYCLKKLKLSKEDAFAFGKKLLKSHDVQIIYPSTIELACDISIRYRFSWWDSLIVATAIESDCDIFYSEIYNTIRSSGIG
ncbi:MAG TPA: PIN domain-containing protein [Chitinophagales bacterium]|nr:PIN domain-containing protein [Chitinophagales bacterium]